jgi:hypothetical protein
MTMCQKSKILFNTETLEKILKDPVSVLDNEKSFWDTEKAQICTKQWAENVKYTISYNKWREKLSDWITVPPKLRKDHILMKITQKIINSKQAFISNALPHLCSYLFPDTDLSTTIYFTAFIPARAFATEDIVINVAAQYWNNNADNILNSLIHEIFHIGYDHCCKIRSANSLIDETLYRILNKLQEEGMCTYVAYRALSSFPAPDERDYYLLNYGDKVRYLLNDLNSLLSKANKVPRDTLEKIAWNKGVISRAYYVVGAYMCKEIEESLGRKILIETLTQGPISFINQYNSISEEKMLIELQGITS